MVTEFVSTIPIIPARDIEASTAWYRDELGFDVVHVEREYGIVRRGESWIHFWGPSGIAPEDSNTMIRLGVRGIDELYSHCEERGIVHPNDPLSDKPWGMREFSVRDRDGSS
jgi:catechol 2,3-dioxygenase-like lactoylglutathione lyase family enzyme